MAIRSSWSEKSDHYAQSGSIVTFPSFYGLIGLFLALAYGIFWVLRLSPYWFNPFWTARSSFAELSLFQNINDAVSTNDYVKSVAIENLPVLHLWLGQLIRSLLRDPIMVGHTIMAIQLALTIGAIFFCVRARSGSFPAFISLIWLLWCVPLVQDFTCGLSSGWELPLVSLFLLTATYGKCSLSLFVVLLSVLLASWHLAPILLITEFLHTFWKVVRKRSRAISIKELKFLLLVIPVFIALFYFQHRARVQTRPVVTYQDAMAIEELSREGGIVPLVPFPDPLVELQQVVEQIVIGAKYIGPEFLRPHLIKVVLGFLGVLIVVGLIRWSSICAAELWCLLCASLAGYIAARRFAFNFGEPLIYIEKLIPLILILMITQATWRVLYLGRHLFEVKNNLGEFWRHEIIERAVSVFVLVSFILFLILSGGTGLNNRLRFDYLVGQEGLVFEWLKKNTVVNSVVAGDPRVLDGLALFSERTPFITNSTVEPWIASYREYIYPRFVASLKIIYAKTASDLYMVLKENKDIDFVLFRAHNYDSDLSKQPLFGKPFDNMVGQREWFYNEIVKIENPSFVVFRDTVSILLDTRKFLAYMEGQSSK